MEERELGDLIAEARTTARLPMRAVAAELGRGAARVSRMESGTAAPAEQEREKPEDVLRTKLGGSW